MPWIQTFSGRKVDLLDPQPESIFLHDIAWSLSRLCRFGGHTNTDQIYSVAQHSYHVSYEVPAEHALAGLMHDAHEAYLGDITRPVKDVIEQLTGGAFARFETKLQLAVFEAFGIAWPIPETVNEADLTLLATERKRVLNKSPHAWDLALPEPKPIEITATIAPIYWQASFLKRFDQVKGFRR